MFPPKKDQRFFPSRPHTFASSATMAERIYLRGVGYKRATRTQNPEEDVSSRDVFAVVTSTPYGWRCRSTLRGVLQHDYVSHEPVDKLISWLRRDLWEHQVFEDRRAALAHLATHISTGDGTVGYLRGDPTWLPQEFAERVCQHLERGF